ncbi:MAG: HIRAN domain-containing protein [Ruminococcus sp.]
MKRTQHSKVMTIANRLVKQGYNRANAMVKAWVLVKLPNICTRVAGVTYSKRQQAIEHLTHYRPENIRISLYRDNKNAYDCNAVAVIATVKDKGSYTMGYLPKALAAFIAPLMDAGRTITSRLAGIRGTNEPYLNYGLGIEVII